jgi:hypothetical protein
MAKTNHLFKVLTFLVVLVLVVQFHLMAAHIGAEDFELIMPSDDDEREREATAATKPRRESRHRPRNRQESISLIEMETSRRRSASTTGHHQRYRPENFAKAGMGSRGENVLAAERMRGQKRRQRYRPMETSRATLQQRGQQLHRQHHPYLTEDRNKLLFENKEVATERQDTTADVGEHNGPNIHTCQFEGNTLSMPHFPSFIIGGAQKSGTTSLMHYLSHHPLIVNSTKNETHFFDFEIPRHMRKLGRQRRDGKNVWCHLRQKYFETWPHEKLLENPHLFSFEKTPSYMHNFGVPHYLKVTCPWIPKVIFTLRNPVDRAYSSYKMAVEMQDNYLISMLEKKKGIADISFEQTIRPEMHENYDNSTIKKKKGIADRSFELMIGAEIGLLREGGVTTARRPLPRGSSRPPVQIPWDHIQDQSRWQNDIFNMRARLGQLVRKGIYAPMLQNWLNNYPKDSIMVIDYRDLHRNTAEVYFRILDFVGIPHDNPSHSFEKKRPASLTNARQDDFPPIKESTRKYLEAFYAPFNAQLEEVLGLEWKGAWTPEWDALA